MAHLLTTLSIYALPLAFILILFFLSYQAFAIASGDEFITLERRWVGKKMADGRTVAFSNEVGVQARTLGPGTHLLTPFIYKVKKHKFITIPIDKIGIVRAITGAPIPSGEYFAKAVECNLFQDGEAFLKSGGQKGPQLDILPPGQHRINPELFTVDIVNAIIIGDDEIGIVESVAGKPCSPGRIFANPVECDDYQSAKDFLQNQGQKGPQTKILGPGKYRINTSFFTVTVQNAVVIPGGKMGLVSAMDGKRIPEGNLLAKKLDGHSNFQEGEKFLEEGGEKGRQLEVLMPGTYRINTALFQIVEIVDWVHIDTNQIGIVTVNEGKPVHKDNIAADIVEMSEHNSFQEPVKYLENGGQKGLQQEVLRSGNYAINPYFATVEKVPMTEIQVGYCGVVTSYVGEEGEDLMKDDNNVNAKIVENGKKGIWKDPLSPGLHPINTRTCKVTTVPTTQILLSWADDVSSAHKFDANLKTIELRTADAFKASMDVRVIIHISTPDAPKVVANLGTVENMIAQVLEPAISSYFRNAAQEVNALDLLSKRSELQTKAKEQIQEALKKHNIESKDTMIAAITLPDDLAKTVTDRQIALQRKATFKVETEAQEEEKKLENVKAQTSMQSEVVKSERGVEIATNIADAEVKKAEGAKKAAVLNAQGEAEAVKLKAGANAESTKLNAEADAEKTQKVGEAEAKIIKSKGQANAEAYEKQVKAMGQDGFVRLQALDKLQNLKLKLIPDNVILGGGSGDNNGMGLMNGMFGVALLEKLTGQPFAALSKNSKANDEVKEKESK